MSLEASEARAFTARPRYFDTLEAWEAADGQVLHVVVSRKRLITYAVARLTFAVIRFFNSEVENPCPYEIEGLWSDDAKAEEHGRQIVAKSLGRKVVMYGPLYVDRAFPDEIVTWRGAVRLTSLFKKRRAAPAQPDLSVLISERELGALRSEVEEWRSGRRETDEVKRLRGMLEQMSGLERRLRDVEARLTALEEAGGRDVVTNTTGGT